MIERKMSRYCLELKEFENGQRYLLGQGALDRSASGPGNDNANEAWKGRSSIRF